MSTKSRKKKFTREIAIPKGVKGLAVDVITEYRLGCDFSTGSRSIHIVITRLYAKTETEFIYDGYIYPSNIRNEASEVSQEIMEALEQSGITMLDFEQLNQVHVFTMVGDAPQKENP